ncbi:hypothetical protein DFJ73DRAFT_815255 [Zopfochytrium polystomum]|nr:hypothetical protein DFJ73DRAFT_815255 [Zopfochytrium polystomum]
MLDSLPVAVLDAIANALPSSLDRCVLSTVNSRLQTALAPSIFCTVRATNLDTDAGAIAAVASAHSHTMRTLHLQCKLFGNSDSAAGEASNDEEEPVGVSHLSATAAALLSGQLALNVTAVTIEFLPHRNYETPWWVDNDDGTSINIAYRHEGMEDASAAEAQFHWRRTMAALWRAIARNPSIRSLTIRSLPPTITTAWCEDAWPTFIGRLERLSIQMWGGQLNGTNCHAIMMDGYGPFLSDHLTRYFFNHAQELRALELIAHSSGCYGGQNYFFGAPTSLGESNMPRLRSLKLHNTFIDKPLLDFICAHAATIESLSLTECMASGLLNVGSESDLSWADFFDGIVQSSPASLTDLVIINRKFPGFGVASYLFSYGDLDPLGSFQPSFEKIFGSRKSRTDINAFNRLKDFVYQNAGAERRR